MRDEILNRELPNQSRRNRVVFFGDLPGILGDLAILLTSTLFVVEALLLFRLFSQVAGSVPHSGPGSWLYQLGGFIVGYFARFEVAPVTNRAPVLELSLFIAVAFFAIVGTGAAVAAFAVSRFAERRWPCPFILGLGTPSPGSVLFLGDPTPVLRRRSSSVHSALPTRSSPEDRFRKSA